MDDALCPPNGGQGPGRRSAVKASADPLVQSARARKGAAAEKTYLTGKRGGVYYISASGKKIYKSRDPLVQAARAKSDAPKPATKAVAPKASAAPKLSPKAKQPVSAPAAEKAKPVSESAVRAAIAGLPKHAEGTYAPVSREKLQEAAMHAAKQLTPAEAHTLQKWTGSHDHEYSDSAYKDILAAERGDSAASPEAKSHAAALRSMIEQHGVDLGAVHRGMSVSPDIADKLLKSDSFKMGSMSSWTSGESMARDFADGSAGTATVKNGVPVVISLKRARGLPIGGNERETLLGATEYKITGRSRGKDGTLHVHLEAA